MSLVRLIYDIVAIPCILFAIFNPKDVLSWVWVKSKIFFVWLWNKIIGIFK